ncbi:CLUMA_CG020665, isoform A [Clunio marinus]|uniref:Zinc carboxypeptidase A 1 n=1 Tax=Clunio marinus TaxID=568069 RepID=A0A1J1J5P4_9DIPT|nr:CLUMA_CG020665, isoform A [Clunio marinus]
MKLRLLLVIFFFSFVNLEIARFDNYRVYSIEIENEIQSQVLQELEATSDSYLFWDSTQKIHQKVDVVVPPHKFADFHEIIKKFSFKLELKIDNLQRFIDDQQPKRQRKEEGDMNWDDYQSLETIYEWIGFLQRDFPEFITVEDIGLSYEGRTIKVVKLSKKQNNRAIFIEAQIHAREWIAGATATYVLNEFLYSNDPEVQDIALNVDWYIIPIMNPDGYEYTRTSNRNWRKTRSPVSLTCDGVDGNRNFAFNFLTADETGNLGASKIPCSDTYAGPSAFSEPETLALETYIASIREKFDVYLSFHSYGHLILYPFGHTIYNITDYEMLQDIGDAMAAKTYLIDEIQYTVGNWNKVLYPSSGPSIDHMYGQHNIPIAYTIEMRGNGPYGNYGFFLPSNFISVNAMEVLNGLIGLVSKAQIILLIFSFTIGSCEKARFDNYRVYSINIDNNVQLSVLKEIEQTSDSYSFWDSPTHVGENVEIVVPPHQFAHYDEIINKFTFRTILIHENLQEVMDKTQPKRQRKEEGDMNWDDYQSLETIYEWIGFLQRDFPEFITVEDIGLSYEGRTIKVVKLSKKQNNRAIFIEAQIHAREWIAGATATYILNEFLYSNDPEIQDIALNVDWYIIPIMNPDGYEYTRTSNRNWRKTRSPVSLTCDGVDGNRNFAFNFLTADETGDLGASKIPCSDTYAGPSAFSEPETTAVENYFSQVHDQFDIYLAFHSYAHVLLYPFGNTLEPVPNVEMIQDIGDAAAARLYSVHSTIYDVGNSKRIL